MTRASKPTTRARRPLVSESSDRMGPAFRDPPTREQMEARLELIQDLILANVPSSLLHQAIVARTRPDADDPPEKAREKAETARRVGWPFPPRQTGHAYSEVRRRLAKRFEDEQPTARALQAARIEADLFRLSQEIAATPIGRRSGLWRAKSHLQEQLIKVQGTAAPLEIRIDPTLGARQTLIAVVMGMSVDEQIRLVDEELDAERKLAVE